MTKEIYMKFQAYQDASEADIKEAYRKLSKKYHPECVRTWSRRKEVFKEIAETYERILGDAQKRAAQQVASGHAS